MKKSAVLMMLIFALALFLAAMPGIYAETTVCEAEVSLINQDPYPASPGEYVKLVFQIDGISNPICGTVKLEVKDQFPIKFDPESSNIYAIQAGFFQRTYGNFATVPFKVRVNENAVHGDNQIETLLSYEGVQGIINNFSISIQDLRSDFDIYTKNYDLATNILTLEIINIGKTNIKALTATILPESGVIVKGPSKNVVGDLDSSDYSTTDFEVSGSGELKLKIEYTDETDTRRASFTTLDFNSSAFEGRKKDEKKISAWTYLCLAIIVILLAIWAYRKYKRNKHR